MAEYERLLASGVDAGLTVHDAAALAALVRARQPMRCLEIGMANGVSAVTILEHTPGHLTSVDPYQGEQWGSAGVKNVAAAGFADRHRLIEAPDFLALPQLVGASERFDLVFVDGWHSFEYVMLDMFYADLLLRPGGVLGFDDCDMPATRRSLRFLLTHRPYIEIVTGPARYTASSPAKTLLRRVLRWSVQDRWFEKQRDEQTRWNFYRRF